MKKFRDAGFHGIYHTQDIGDEFNYYYKDISEINISYDAILCLDVIEHLDGLSLIFKMVNLLKPGGVLIIQTSNARCIRNPLSWDMTHVHLYNLPDLWAFIKIWSLETTGYRIVFTCNSSRWQQWNTWILLKRFIISRILSCDYADNIAIIAKKIQ